ncbi:hypothetical protein ABB55_19425 [Prosthecomicrobium hirschii]|uniref:YARHG domain-containing protein n=1 Tax=Prosthecodimorpha hirschii TaxID=665126 RepID=A0A0P6W4E6_9HYPH|nr:hypothetical protein [Prosthecomicrobium hirschii]KPL54117.1 hypothetical protein ABB55_19425 [Prosthecomicrobium hirschii]
MTPVVVSPQLCLLFAAVSGILLAGSPARADYESYGVFCASGRIEVDSRSAEQMQSNRGACQFARFPTRSDAENFARRNFGGVGGACSCR